MVCAGRQRRGQQAPGTPGAQEGDAGAPGALRAFPLPDWPLRAPCHRAQHSTQRSAASLRLKVSQARAGRFPRPRPPQPPVQALARMGRLPRPESQRPSRAEACRRARRRSAWAASGAGCRRARSSTSSPSATAASSKRSPAAARCATARCTACTSDAARGRRAGPPGRERASADLPRAPAHSGGRAASTFGQRRRGGGALRGRAGARPPAAR